MTLGFCLLPLLGCASAPERIASDHFDGEKFFNPTLEEQFSPGFTDVVRMMREGRPDWPESVENVGVPQFATHLEPGGVSVTFVNHATFLIQLPDLNILTDPIWSERASPMSWIGPKRVRLPGVELEELPRIDVVVISHNHYDHLDKETLRKLDDLFSPQVIVPVGDKELIESLGIDDVVELDWWEHVEVGADTQIVFAPAQHSSARGLFDRDRSLWGSYFICNGNSSVYFGGDAGYSTHYADIRERLGAPDIALLGIGAYLPRWFMRPMHMDPAEAVVAHQDLEAGVSIGMHFGTFQLAGEEFDQPLLDLEEALESEGVPRDRFIVLHEGETRIYERTRLGAN